MFLQNCKMDLFAFLNAWGYVSKLIHGNKKRRQWVSKAPRKKTGRQFLAVPCCFIRNNLQNVGFLKTLKLFGFFFLETVSPMQLAQVFMAIISLFSLFFQPVLQLLTKKKSLFSTCILIFQSQQTPQEVKKHETQFLSSLKNPVPQCNRQGLLLFPTNTCPQDD